MCSRCLMDPHSTGQQGVAVLLRLTSTRLFLAEDLLTAHLTLWSAHERQLTVADSWNTPRTISLYNTLLTLFMWWGLSEQKQKKNPKNGGCKNIIKERLISGQLMETSSSFGEGWGQRLSIEAWFMICSVLHVCSQVSGSYTQLEQQGLGVCFSEDKLKLDTFISASAAEELVTALSKVVFFDHPAQNVGNSNRPWQVKRKIQRNTKCL